jgi:hypothetical protein
MEFASATTSSAKPGTTDMPRASMRCPQLTHSCRGAEWPPGVTFQRDLSWACRAAALSGLLRTDGKTLRPEECGRAQKHGDRPFVQSLPLRQSRHRPAGAGTRALMVEGIGFAAICSNDAESTNSRFPYLHDESSGGWRRPTVRSARRIASAMTPSGISKTAGALMKAGHHRRRRTPGLAEGHARDREEGPGPQSQIPSVGR